MVMVPGERKLELILTVVRNYNVPQFTACQLAKGGCVGFIDGDAIIICPIAIAYSMRQIVKPFCPCPCVRVADSLPT